jgi:hypothetical protein
MYLGKKVLVIPMTAQYEQQCNAVGAEAMGAVVIKGLNEKYYDVIGKWITEGKAIKVSYPDITADIIDLIIKTHAPAHARPHATAL